MGKSGSHREGPGETAVGWICRKGSMEKTISVSELGFERWPIGMVCVCPCICLPMQAWTMSIHVSPSPPLPKLHHYLAPSIGNFLSLSQCLPEAFLNILDALHVLWQIEPNFRKIATKVSKVGGKNRCSYRVKIPLCSLSGQWILTVVWSAKCSEKSCGSWQTKEW